jgi:tRNA(Arg) A34 adenosine deaminase TadA
MWRAIDKARSGIAAGQTPFGACIVRAGQAIACEHNVVWATTDITAHAEVQAIRAACRALGTIDLSGSTIYSTCEPCPMCFAAIHWARIGRIVYGAAISDAQAAGFNELAIPSERLKQLGDSHVQIAAGILRDECAALFERWLSDPRRRAY